MVKKIHFQIYSLGYRKQEKNWVLKILISLEWKKMIHQEIKNIWDSCFVYSYFEFKILIANDSLNSNLKLFSKIKSYWSTAVLRRWSVEFKITNNFHLPILSFRRFKITQVKTSFKQIFLWSLRRSTKCVGVNWSQNEWICSKIICRFSKFQTKDQWIRDWLTPNLW